MSTTAVVIHLRRCLPLGKQSTSSVRQKICFSVDLRIRTTRVNLTDYIGTDDQKTYMKWRIYGFGSFIR